jgi:hypothetical protein
MGLPTATALIWKLELDPHLSQILQALEAQNRAVMDVDAHNGCLEVQNEAVAGL